MRSSNISNAPVWVLLPICKYIVVFKSAQLPEWSIGVDLFLALCPSICAIFRLDSGLHVRLPVTCRHVTLGVGRELHGNGRTTLLRRNRPRLEIAGVNRENIADDYRDFYDRRLRRKEHKQADMFMRAGAGWMGSYEVMEGSISFNTPVGLITIKHEGRSYSSAFYS